MAKTAVVKKKVQEVVLSNVDQLFEENAGAGLATAPRENVVPLIKIIQDQTKADVKKILDDAGGKTGDLYNNVSYEIYDGDQGLIVVPCAYNRRYFVWGGGDFEGKPPIAVYTPEDKLPEIEGNAQNPDDRKQYIKGAGDGSYLEEQANHFVLVCKENGQYEPAIVVMKSSQFKNSRRWNSMINSQTREGKNGIFTPPRYANKYLLKSTDETNAKGSYKGFNVSHYSQVNGDEQHLVERAISFAKSVEEDNVSNASFSEDNSASNKEDDNAISKIVG